MSARGRRGGNAWLGQMLGPGATTRAWACWAVMRSTARLGPTCLHARKRRAQPLGKETESRPLLGSGCHLGQNLGEGGFILFI